MHQEDDRFRDKRRAYAQHIVARAGIDVGKEVGRAIRTAFEIISREKFVGMPPWRIISPEGQFEGVSGDPTAIYQDVLVALDTGKGLNNGQPSLHGYCLNALAPQKGECAVHVGAGTGYYTAILAELVGGAGRVDAYEIEPELAHEAAKNLAEYRSVQTHCRSGAEAPIPECDVLYVSAACAEPMRVWLDALRLGGRLLFPMESEGSAGRMLLVTKQGEQIFDARFLCAVQFVACLGAQTTGAARELDAAFERGNWESVKSLRLDAPPEESCWCAGAGWWLSTEVTFG